MKKKTLWILRHGDAGEHATRDELRELTDFGREQVRRQMLFFKNKNGLLEELWVSPYIRAQQTADEVLNTLSVSCERKEKACLQPDSNIDEVVKSLLSSRAKNLMLVSHQPLVGKLIDTLKCDTDGVAFMQTAALACLSADEWLAGYSTLRFVQQA